MAASYGAFDGAAQPYGTYEQVKASAGPYSTSASSSSITVGASSSCGSPKPPLSITGSVAEVEAKMANTFYGEGSGPSKRPHFEEEPTQSTQGTVQQQFQQQQPTGLQQVPGGIPYQFQAVGDRPKKKGQKRTGKKTEPQSLVGMMDDSTGAYDKPMSIRHVLKNNKIDMTWMDYLAWSPSACKELKRLCTRVSKKRIPKAKSGQNQPIQPTQPFQPMGFNPVLPSEYQMSSTLPPLQNILPIFQPVQPMQPQQMQQPNQPMNQGSSSGSLASTVSSMNVGTGADAHIRFLQTLVGVEKAFRIPAVVRSQGQEVNLERRHTQADQGSELNVISGAMVRQLGLEVKSLAEIGFHGMSMTTADHKEHMLLHWVLVEVGVQGIWRKIRCFIGPDLSLVPGHSEHLSLLLGIPWLFAVNAVISIRQSKILLGDPEVGEAVREVAEPELVFHKDHNLLMYPKEAFPVQSAPVGKGFVVEIEDADSSDSESSDFGDDLSDVEDPISQTFQ